ncbi:MAG: hypothetical protein Q4A88_09195 [Clostridia bacterium]|nr:hypothetical protein [Clostridia bacterium]
MKKISVWDRAAGCSAGDDAFRQQYPEKFYGDHTRFFEQKFIGKIRFIGQQRTFSVFHTVHQVIHIPPQIYVEIMNFSGFERWITSYISTNLCGYSGFSDSLTGEGRNGRTHDFLKRRGRSAARFFLNRGGPRGGKNRMGITQQKYNIKSLTAKAFYVMLMQTDEEA